MRQHNFNLPKQMLSSYGSTGQLVSANKKIQNYMFNLNEVLGRGNFSQVYKAVNITNNETVAIKVIEISKMKAPSLHNLLSSEIDILKKINHQNILNCLEVFTSTNNCYIITELCDSDLQSTLKKTGPLEEKSARKIIHDIFQGLRYLAEEKIVHRDIKIANIFLKNGITKIADFGFAKNATQNFRDISIGTPIYMAPQGLIENLYGPKTDIWAFGVVIYQILHGNPPLAFCQTEPELKLHITIPIREQRFKHSISAQLQNLIMRCLQVDWQKRPTVFQLLKHPYIQGLLRQFSKQQHFPSNNENLSPQRSHQKLESLNVYPLSYKCLNVPQVGQFLTVPKSPDSSTRRTSIQYYDSQTSSRLLNFSSGARSTSNSNIKSSNSGLNFETIITKISFQQALQLLHYCRLLFKTRQLILLQPALSSSPLVDCYGNIIIQLITELGNKISDFVVFSGSQSQSTQKKLRQVVSQYYVKYTSAISKRIQIKDYHQSFEGFSMCGLQAISSLPREIMSRKDQIVLSVYIKYALDVNKIINSCMLMRSYSPLLHDVNIEEFLKTKYEAFDQTYYIPIRAKLLQMGAN